ncbi:MAG: hypothetical protein II680_13145 [Clostridia bacterium]|nr:hypothetical protein [Clostridia bacterium]
MKKLPYRNPVSVAAHRGNAKFFPENTMAGFRNAVTLRPDMIELDLHMTADGEIVMMHDHRVDRTTDGKGLIREKTSKRSSPSTPEAGRGRNSAGSASRSSKNFSISCGSIPRSCSTSN